LAEVDRPDLHLHDLRHSGNTWAAATGASTAELMARMGHASPVAALRYQHATEERDRAIAEALSKLATPAPIGRRPPARWSTQWALRHQPPIGPKTRSHQRFL